METNDRIAQWEKMTHEAPDDMAWFSLGNAYKDAGRHADAERALGEAIKFNPGMSRAYQLRAQVLMQLGKNAEAGELLTKGYVIAAEKGDTMPMRAMGSLLEKLGKPLPAVKTAAPPPTAPPPGAGAPNAIIDRKTGQPGTRLPDPPMRGPLGKFIFEHYSQETWRDWIKQGTKVINELRLDLSNPQHAKVWDQQMMEWLGISEEDIAAAPK